MASHDGSIDETQAQIIEQARILASIIDQAPALQVGGLRLIAAEIIAPEHVRLTRPGVLQLGITKETTTHRIDNVAGGVITGNTLTYHIYDGGVKKLVTQELPERLSFNV